MLEWKRTEGYGQHVFFKNIVIYTYTGNELWITKTYDCINIFFSIGLTSLIGENLNNFCLEFVKILKKNHINEKISTSLQKYEHSNFPYHGIEQCIYFAHCYNKCYNK